MSDLDPADEALGRHIIVHCFESDVVEDHAPGEVDLHWDEWSIESVDRDGTAIEVHATQDGYETTLASRRTRHHPAEYEHHDGTAHAIARADWSDDPLAGDCEMVIEWEGGKPLPPDPEPEPF